MHLSLLDISHFHIGEGQSVHRLRVGEDLEWADLVNYIFVDFATGRALSGIDDVASFSLTCKSTTITGFGRKATLDDDERIEPGTINVSEAA